ncbi:MAG: hypothetical protein WD872_16580 [Pirellulaceae bacterium]
MHLCLCDLASLVEGELRFGPLPPLAGEWTAIGSIAVDSRAVQPGDLFWRIPGLACQTACSTQHALFRGACGVVTPIAGFAPWPGRFGIEVEDPAAALARLVAWLDENRNLQDSAELKVLQLCGRAAPVITPPTCGRVAAEQLRSRCRQRAA